MTSSRRTRRPCRVPAATAAVPAVSAALAVLLLGACGVGTDRAQTDSREASGSSAPGSASSDPSSGSSGTGSSATASGGDGDAGEQEPAEVLGSAQGQHAAAPLDDTPVPLRLDVTSVQRLDGEAVEVRFTITNTGDGATYEPWATMADRTLDGVPRYDVGGATLSDLPSNRRYLTLIDTGEACLCSTFDGSGGAGIAPGGSSHLYATFPAPPQTTTTVDFALPGFTSVTGLEIG